eukprot:4512221-Prymnesium_polylepis.1
MHAALATLIMYYDERDRAAEMPCVLDEMRQALRKLMPKTADVHTVLIEWGVIVRARFDTDNLHLTAGDDHDGTDQVVTAIKQLGGVVSRMQATPTQMGARIEELENSRQRDVEALLG